ELRLQEAARRLEVEPDPLFCEVRRIRPDSGARGSARQETIMKKLLTLIALIAVVSVPLLAHHGRGATSDVKKRVTLEGTVSCRGTTARIRPTRRDNSCGVSR